jgi:DNA (cytosine-5)-methyltransferase 1
VTETPAFYNDSSAFAAVWLRRLQARGAIAPGLVDARPVQEVDFVPPAQAHFFAGVGAWSYALRLAGVPDTSPVWTGSCPCQPFSVAGKRRGDSDARHLWPVWRNLIEKFRPPVIFGEQVASRSGRAWLAAVRADMEALGYAVGAADLCAASVGAPHNRPRLFFGAALADAYSSPCYRGAVVAQRSPSPRTVARGHDEVGDKTCDPWRDRDLVLSADGAWRAVQPGTLPLAHGPPHRVGRLLAYGNTITPHVASAFVRSFLSAIGQAD